MLVQGVWLPTQSLRQYRLFNQFGTLVMGLSPRPLTDILLVQHSSAGAGHGLADFIQFIVNDDPEHTPDTAALKDIYRFANVLPHGATAIFLGCYFPRLASQVLQRHIPYCSGGAEVCVPILTFAPCVFCILPAGKEAFLFLDSQLITIQPILATKVGEEFESAWQLFFKQGLAASLRLHFIQGDKFRKPRVPADIGPLHNPLDPFV